MNILITNEDYNFIRNRMLRLEESYKQSIDQKIREVIKNKTLFEICEKIPDFYEKFSDKFNNCKMSSLAEISSLIDCVMNYYEIEKLKMTTEKEVNKLLKIKDKTLKTFTKSYNETVKNKNLTYYSKIIDDKLIILLIRNNEIYGSVTNINMNVKNKECLCYFCRKFRRGDEILFITKQVKNKKNYYTTVGQTVCSDYEKCNKDIEKNDNLISFLK